MEIYSDARFQFKHFIIVAPKIVEQHHCGVSYQKRDDKCDGPIQKENRKETHQQRRYQNEHAADAIEDQVQNHKPNIVIAKIQ